MRDGSQQNIAFNHRCQLVVPLVGIADIELHSLGLLACFNLSGSAHPVKIVDATDEVPTHLLHDVLTLLLADVVFAIALGQQAILIILAVLQSMAQHVRAVSLLVDAGDERQVLR